MTITLFSANAGGGTELWATDGTTAETFRVKDINPIRGASSFPFNASSPFAVLNGFAYFTAGDSAGDLIELHGYGVTNFAALQPLMSQVGNDTLIALDADNHILLQNVTLAQLNAGDFLLS